MHYHTLGQIPQKRHIQFRKPNGELYSEELFSTEGFSDLYSLLYHTHPPTQIVQVGDPFSVCLLYTSPSPRDATLSRMPSSA